MFTNKLARFQRCYVSEIDQFLQELNNMQGAKSNSRIEEEQKYKRIFALRDTPQATPSEPMPWNKF